MDDDDTQNGSCFRRLLCPSAGCDITSVVHIAWFDSPPPPPPFFVLFPPPPPFFWMFYIALVRSLASHSESTQLDCQVRRKKKKKKSVELSLCLTKRNTMMTYWGVEVQLHTLTSASGTTYNSFFLSPSQRLVSFYVCPRNDYPLTKPG